MEKIRSLARSISLTPTSWIISLAGIVFIRTFFEQYSSFEPKRFFLIDPSSLLHAISFYASGALVLTVIFLLFTKGDLKEIFAIPLLGLPLILIGPIVDLVSGGIGGHIQSYIFQPLNELPQQFFSFYGQYQTNTVTLGMRVQILSIIIFSSLYIYSATKSYLRSFGIAIFLYILIFLGLSGPSFLAVLTNPLQSPSDSIAGSIISSGVISNSIYPEFKTTMLGLVDLGFNKVLLGINILVAFFASILLFFTGMRSKFVTVMKNCRPEKVGLFFLLFTVGVILAQNSWPENWIDVQGFVLALIAFFCAWMFSVCQNDIHDEAIDSISNKNRPLVSKKLSIKNMDLISSIFLIFSLFSAYASGSYVLFFVVLFLLIFFIYSNPPLRLKRLLIINPLLSALASLCVILAGYFFVSPDKAIIAFAPKLALMIIIFSTLANNVRDIKDTEGDRASGIKTLPVIIGEKRAKKVMAGIIIFLFISIPWFLHIPYLIIPSIICAGLHAYFLTRENYKEWKTSLVDLLYLICAIVVIVLM